MCNKKRRQSYVAGAVIQINLRNEKAAYGRILGGIIAIYDFVSKKSEKTVPVKSIIDHPILFYCTIYESVVTKGIFEIIEQIDVSEEDIRHIPPGFTQDLANINDCVIFYHDDRIPQFKATPQECIGLERSSVWDESNIIERIEDHFLGRKNFSYELFKPILSEDDIRFMSGPFLRWDFEAQTFYRVTEEQLLNEREKKGII